MEKKTWRFYFTEDDYRQIRASRMTVALQSALDYDLDKKAKKTNDPIDKYIFENTGLKLYDSELHDILIMKTYMVSKLEEVFDDLSNKQYTEDEIKELYQKSFIDVFENVIADFYINDNSSSSYYEIVEPILSASMDRSDETSKEIIDSIEETIDKVQEDSLPKIVIPDEFKNEEQEDEIKEEQQEETEKEEIEEKPVDEKDEPTDEKDDNNEEGSSSIKVEM